MPVAREAHANEVLEGGPVWRGVPHPVPVWYHSDNIGWID